MKRQLALALALAVFLLAGCGGGGGNSSVPGTSSTKAQAKTVPGSVVLSIPVASTTTQSSSRNVRYPQFVSPNASSVTLSINGGADTLFDVSPTSSLCTTVAGSRNCTLAFAAPAGNDTFAFIIFSGANGTGTQLASANSSQPIVAGQAFNFAVALNAAVGTIIVGFTPVHGSGTCPDGPIAFNGINEGCTGGAPLTYTVDDPSGATISGSAPYASPIQITLNDPSLAATPNQITAPGQTVMLSYTGAPFTTLTNVATVTLTAGGQTGSLSIPVEHSYLYVANSNAPLGTAPPGNGNITVYTFGASGAAAPVRTIGGATSGITTPIKPLVDSAGNLYVLDNNIPISTIFNPTIRVFAPGTNGNIAPIRQITNIGGVSGNAACSDMVFDPTGQFLFASCGLDVFVFPVSSNTTASSALVAEFENDSQDISNGLAFDLSGNLYVADQGFNGIFIIPSAQVPTSGGFHLYGGTSLSSGPSWPSSVMPFFIVVDDSGTLLAPVWYQNSTAGPADAQAELGIWNGNDLCDNCAPSATLDGAPFTTQHAQAGIALDPAGNVYVDNPFTNLITEFSRATIAGATISTTATALRTLNNNSSGTTGAVGMAVGP